MLVMSVGFNPESAGDTKATLQFEFTGSVKGVCHFIISDGSFKAREGTAENPDLTIKSPFDAWMDIITHKADGAELFMEGKYQVEGNAEFLLMDKYFGRTE